MERTQRGLRTEQPAAWAKRYARYLSVTDAVVVIAAVLLAEAAWHSWTVSVGVSPTGPLVSNPHSIASVVLIVCWLIALSAYGTRDARIIGQGTLEYRRVLQSSLMLFGTYAIVAVVLDLQLGRSFVLTAFPLAALGLISSRWAWRQFLVRRREAGEYVSRALLVGSRHSVEHLAEQLAGQPSAGYAPVFGCVPGGQEGETLGRRGVRVVGTIKHVELVLSRIDIDCVIVTSSDELPAGEVRRLGWALEASGTDLIVAPALTDIAGPRMHTRPVAGLPLIHVESPVFGGRKVWTKVALDKIVAGVAVLALLPVFVTIALVIAATSPGPVIFRQQRVGLGGNTFTMFKFRSMRVDAEEHLASLIAERRDAGNSVLFKMKDDPRLTRPGAFLRRYSLDELPQLFNVLNGTMSLVGPRPPLDSETKAYEKHNFRRFLVRPGITGLWQVSGRSDLSWEDSVRLDLYYVENWSVLNDLILLGRTARAVIRGSGAY
jgi:exopolysaccharide biosynthesis polyprenyl glycosylphosphotransferase